MLLPAIGSARTAARVAAVTNDMKVIEKGLEDFKLKFGTYPPSTFVFVEDGSYNTTAPHRASLAFMRQAWPNFDPTSATIDLNGNGTADQTLVLDGAECLAFFLGGMCSTQDASGSDLVTRGMNAGDASYPAGTGTPASWAPNGFSTNPANPFARSTGSRVGPFFEFSDLSRFVDVDGDSMPGMLDSLPSQTVPLVYFSSYEGRGYPSASDADFPTASVFSSLEDVYRKDGSAFSDTPFNQQTFQIISPGFDAAFGTAGHYDGSSVGTSDDSNSGVTATTRAQSERDNITNFSGGMLN